MVTEDLGDLCGLDYDTAFFMRYGKYPPPRERKKTAKFEYFSNDFELDEELYNDFKMSNFTEYFDPAQTYRYALYK